MEHGGSQYDNPTVQETIRIAMQRLSKSGRAGVTKKHILKVLFLARENLPVDNRIRDDLAYYWYKEGPYSEVIYANLDRMQKDGLVKASATGRSETYRLDPDRALRPITQYDSVMDATKREIGQMANEFSNVHAAVGRTYEKAPFKWYTTYNLEFKPRFESHCRAVLDGRDCDAAQDILGRLDDAVLDYPANLEFTEHRAIFMDFAKMLNAFLRWDSYRTRKDMMEVLYVLCGRIWNVFTYGVRIYYHDPYYDDRVVAWTAKYKQELVELDSTVRSRLKEFDKVVVDNVEMDPDVIDMILHPEKYKFEPLVPSTIAGNE